LVGNLFVGSIPGGMHRRDLDPRMMDAYRAPFPRLLVAGRHPCLPARDPAYRARPQRGADGSIHERLGELDLPALLVWGMRDPVFQPVFLDQWRELFPTARSVELEDAAHYLVEDCPEAVTAALAEFAASI
jgi:haloalkane dehalogenase